MSTVAERFASDTAKFFETGRFPGSLTATYTPQGGSPASIVVVFDEHFQATALVDSQFSASVPDYENTVPAALCKSSDVSGVKHGDTLVANAVTYYVRGIQSDGLGTTVLILSRD